MAFCYSSLSELRQELRGESRGALRSKMVVGMTEEEGQEVAVRVS